MDPRSMLALPRPGTPVVNPSRTLALWPSSTYRFETRRTTKSLYLVDLTGRDDASAASFERIDPPLEILTDLVYTETAWLDDSTFVYLRPTVAVTGGSDKERTQQLQASTGTQVWAQTVDITGKATSEYKVADLPVSISSIRTKNTAPGKTLFAFMAEVYPDGDLSAVAQHDADFADADEGADVKVYDTTWVRHWDAWAPTHGQRTQVFFTEFTQQTSVRSGLDSASPSGSHLAPLGAPLGITPWTVSSSSPTNVLLGTDINVDSYDLSATHILVSAKDPALNVAWHTRCQVWLAPLHPRSERDRVPQQLTRGTQGACASPALSHDGSAAAWLEMAEDGFEADINRVVVYELGTGTRRILAPSWDRSPGALSWRLDDAALYLLTHEDGHGKVFRALREGTDTPIALTSEHTVASIESLGVDGHLGSEVVLLTMNSITTPNELWVGEVSGKTGKTVEAASKEGFSSSPTTLTLLSSLTAGPLSQFTLNPPEAFYFKGAKADRVQGWVVYPPDYDAKKTYPLAFLVHGGPQGAWNDDWNTRWNPSIYAQHGYLTVAINPTGSSGFGHEFLKGVSRNWGGTPYLDLVAGLAYVKANYPIDPERTAMLGASYGGYMANWIQGHNDATKFQCIVCHDGMMNVESAWYITEELYFPEYEFGGVPWDPQSDYLKYSPTQFVSQWKTPQLIIHGGKDYRLPDTEGIAAFMALQRQGVPSRFVYFPNENHWVLNPLNSARWHKEVLGWLDKWCRR